MDQEECCLKLLSETHHKLSDLTELEFLSNAKGVLHLFNQINDTDSLSTLRIYDLDKVKFNIYFNLISLIQV